MELPRQKILCEVKYCNNSHIPVMDIIVELCKDEQSKGTSAFLVTKQLDDFGISKHETSTPIMRVPALAFLYFLGKAEAEMPISITFGVSDVSAKSIEFTGLIVANLLFLIDNIR